MVKQRMFSSQLSGGDRSLEIDFLTNNICPRCGIGVDHLIINSFFTASASHYNIYLIAKCPVCHKVALCEYTVHKSIVNHNYIDLCRFIGSIFPCESDEHVFPENISELSPDFVRLYHQSEQAEKNGSPDICGMGYRKAIEFLIKDFLIHLNPDKYDRIANMQLSPAINLLENQRLKTLAKRCAWLGNDEAHYIRKHEDYSVADLKTFILASVAYIDSELCVEQAEAINPVRG